MSKTSSNFTTTVCRPANLCRYQKSKVNRCRVQQFDLQILSSSFCATQTYRRRSYPLSAHLIWYLVGDRRLLPDAAGGAGTAPASHKRRRPLRRLPTQLFHASTDTSGRSRTRLFVLVIVS